MVTFMKEFLVRVTDKRASRKKPSKKKDKRYPFWKSLHGQQITLKCDKDTPVGVKTLIYKCTFLTRHRDYPYKIIVKDLECVDSNPHKVVHIVDLNKHRLSKESVRFAKYSSEGGKVAVNLLRIVITEVNGRPLNRLYGLNLKNWSTWALHATYLKKFFDMFGFHMTIKPNNSISLCGSINRDLTISLIKIYNKAPLDKAQQVVEELNKEGYYSRYGRRQKKIKTLTQGDKFLSSTLGDVFKL